MGDFLLTCPVSTRIYACVVAIPPPPFCSRGLEHLEQVSGLCGGRRGGKNILLHEQK